MQKYREFANFFYYIILLSKYNSFILFGRIRIGVRANANEEGRMVGISKNKQQNTSTNNRKQRNATKSEQKCETDMSGTRETGYSLWSPK